MTDAALPDAAAAPASGRALAGRPLALLGLVLIALTVLAAIFAPGLTPFSPDEQFFDGLTLEGAPLPPGGAVSGSAPTCSAATCSPASSTARAPRWSSASSPTASALLIGTLVGVTAGYFARLDRRRR